MHRISKLNPREIFIKFHTKKGKKESIEKKTNLLFLQLKKKLHIKPTVSFTESLNNHKLRLSYTRGIKILSPEKQLKSGIHSLIFNHNLLQNLIGGIKNKGAWFKKKKKIYKEAIQNRFIKKGFKKKR
jgi:hypothetical protein